MQISLSKSSDVALHEQLAEQIVFSIATGKLRQGENLPSVRSLARRLAIHHNTVSKAYQELCRRGWLLRQRGARLTVGVAGSPKLKTADTGLDHIINSGIDKAREAGYSLQALQSRVMQRLFEQRPDHILAVEREVALRSILQAEIVTALRKPVESCSPAELEADPELAVGAQVVAPEYSVRELRPFVPQGTPCIPLTFSTADEPVAVVRGLPDPSNIGVASVSRNFVENSPGVAGRRGRPPPYFSRISS